MLDQSNFLGKKIFKKNKEKILSLIKNPKNYHDNTHFLSAKDQSVIYEIFQLELLAQIDTAHAFYCVMKHIFSENEKLEVYEKFKNCLSKWIVTTDDLYEVFEVLNEKQRNSLFDAIGNQLLALKYSDVYDKYETLVYLPKMLTNHQYEIFLETQKNIILESLETSEILLFYVDYLSHDYFKLFCEKFEDKIKTLLTLETLYNIFSKESENKGVVLLFFKDQIIQHINTFEKYENFLPTNYLKEIFDVCQFNILKSIDCSSELGFFININALNISKHICKTYLNIVFKKVTDEMVLSFKNALRGNEVAKEVKLDWLKEYVDNYKNFLEQSKIHSSSLVFFKESDLLTRINTQDNFINKFIIIVQHHLKIKPFFTCISIDELNLEDEFIKGNSLNYQV